MEIIKMFSSCDGENLYTVCFSEDEMKLYSDFKEIFNDGIKGAVAGAIGGGPAAAYTSNTNSKQMTGLFKKLKREWNRRHNKKKK